MEIKPQQGQGKSRPGSTRMPSNSLFYEKVVPVLLVIFGVVLVLLVLFAAAVLVGWVRF